MQKIDHVDCPEQAVESAVDSAKQSAENQIRSAKTNAVKIIESKIETILCDAGIPKDISEELSKYKIGKNQNC